MEYYYSINGNDKNGPFSYYELKQKNITPKTLIWYEGLEDWKMAEQIPELENLIEKASETLKKKETVQEKINLDEKTATNNPETLVVNKKQKMFSKLFSYKGRIRRLEYGITFIIMYLGFAFIGGMAEVEETLALLIIPLYWVVLVQGAKRCHDLGNSGWYQLIPFYFFWMIFAKGDDGVNEYGPNPKM
jgi:uncharacterized membrane protein YhaH (DUF805 family)